ncbi:MAG: DUF3160 domain-containing protein [Candidatus Thorarchaeota archaeon]
MNSKKKIIISIIFCLSISLGLIPILILKTDFNTNQNSDENDKYPDENNPYYTLYYNYRSGILPEYEPYYDLELGDNLSYFNRIDQSFSLTNAEKQLLEQKKFVVLNRMGTDDIVDAFSFYWNNDLPVFITTDMILHVWHLIFDKVLEQTEEDIFFPLLRALSIEIMNYISDNSIFDAHTIIYFNVASKLVNSSLDLDLSIEIEQASEYICDAIMNLNPIIENDLTKRFIDDYSQYKPRGHYTKSEELKMYFRLYKWFARIPFFFDDYPSIAILNVTPEHMIKTAIEVTWLLKNIYINYLDQKVSGLQIWEAIMDFLKIIMGSPNSITPRHLNSHCEQVIGNNWHPINFDDDKIAQIKNNILNDPSIPVPDMPFFSDIIAYGTQSPKTFTLFGEMETLDSYSLQCVVHPYIDKRLLPHGLDFAYTCLESNHSLQLLQEAYSQEFIVYPDYLENLNLVKDEISSAPEEKKVSLQWNWIKSLKSLSVEIPASNNTVILPEFMNSSAWLDEKLTTIMGSYAQLRHDTILYTKQSYSGIICSTPTAYVEPYPDFYKSIGQLAQLFKTSFIPLVTLGYNLTSGYFNFLRFLNTFTDICVKLEEISIKELARIPLNSEDKTFITSIYHERDPDYCGPTLALGWLPFLLRGFSYSYSSPSEAANSRATLIADIHTDPNYEQVLHISTGFLEHIITYVPSWDGHEIPVVGPVFSYYEFPAPDLNRLTDEEWRGILAIWLDGQNVGSHNFDLIKRGFWADSYMVSTSITSSIIYSDTFDYDPPDWF